MSFFGKYLSPLYFGAAASKFVQKRYKDAARLFEKALSLDPYDKGIEYHYACLGRSYLAIEKYSEALDALSKAYAIYMKEKPAFENDFERQEFEQMLLAYKAVLLHFGNINEAKEIIREYGKMGIELGDYSKEGPNKKKASGTSVKK